MGRFQRTKLALARVVRQSSRGRPGSHAEPEISQPLFAEVLRTRPALPPSYQPESSDSRKDSPDQTTTGLPRTLARYLCHQWGRSSYIALPKELTETR